MIRESCVYTLFTKITGDQRTSLQPSPGNTELNYGSLTVVEYHAIFKNMRIIHKTQCSVETCHRTEYRVGNSVGRNNGNEGKKSHVQLLL
jgi:hypothetical protein